MAALANASATALPTPLFEIPKPVYFGKCNSLQGAKYVLIVVSVSVHIAHRSFPGRSLRHRLAR